MIMGVCYVHVFHYFSYVESAAIVFGLIIYNKKDSHQIVQRGLCKFNKH